jgi:hypothetical protein
MTGLTIHDTNRASSLEQLLPESSMESANNRGQTIYTVNSTKN